MPSIDLFPVSDGESYQAVSGGQIDIIDPATGSVIGHQACCSDDDVARIVESSQRAFDDPSWQQLAPAERGGLLLAVADLLESEAERLIELELLDTGKPIAQLRDGEIPLSAAILRFYAGAADKVDGAVKNSPGGLHFTKFQPYGVVAGILPWNYPLVNAVLKVAPALAAGNALVLKPSVETPLGAVEFAHLCRRAGVPPGIVNVVTGSGSTAGNALVSHPGVKKISFTGSTVVGQAIQRLAADQMKAVNLECGGKNAIVVFADADLEQAAEAVLFSGLVNAGQLCVSCSRLLVESSVAKQMEGLLLDKLSKLKIGDPREETTQVGPMITRSQYDRVLHYLEIGKAEGCRLLNGGCKLDVDDELSDGMWIEPTLFAGVTPEMQVGCEEIFGPVLSILEFEDEADAIRIANSVEYGLSGSVWTSQVDRALRMIDQLETGIIWVNTMMAGYPQIPLAPHKMSGTGVELGMEGLMPFLKRKSAVISSDPQTPIGWALG